MKKVYSLFGTLVVVFVFSLLFTQSVFSSFSGSAGAVSSVISISGASRLDGDKNIIEDIYDQVKAKDNTWVTLKDGEYVRATFEQALTDKNDITLYAKSVTGSTIEVYSQVTGQLVTTFDTINTENSYKVLLNNLAEPADVFDLKITGSIDIDYIVDPNSWTFSNVYPVGKSGNLSWLAIGGDDDLSNLVIGKNPGYVYTSSDFGVSWTMRTIGGYINDSNSNLIQWVSVASDSDGSNLIIASKNNSTSLGLLFTSSDYGVTWVERQPEGAVQLLYGSVASDADGSNLFVSVQGGKLYTSSDFGQSWVETKPNGDAGMEYSYDVRSDSDGTVLMVANPYTGFLYISTNSGTTWSARGVGKIYCGGGCSYNLNSDGSLMVGAAYNNKIYKSIDQGVNWTELLAKSGSSSGYWGTVAISGNTIVAGESFGRLFISDNSGSTWGEQRPVGVSDRTYANARLSTSGDKLFIDVNQLQEITGPLYVGSMVSVTAPTITSSAATSITATGATLNGNITNTGGENNTVRGFEYGLTTAYGTATSTTGSYSTGAYTAIITGLTSETTYHYRAFSTNSAGTSSSTDETFTTLDINSPVITILGDNPAFVNQNATYTDAGATSTDTVDGDLTSSIVTTINVDTAIVGDSSVVYTVADTSGNPATSTRVVTVLDITDPNLSAITSATASSSVTITWTTDEPATSRVQYGPSSSYGDITTTSDLTGTTTHSVTIPNLLSCTNYHYRVISADLSDNTATSSDYTFSISGCTSGASIIASSTQEVVTASGTTITIGDLTLYIPVNYSATTSSATFQAKLFSGLDFLQVVTAPSSFLHVGDYIYNLEALINATTALTIFDIPLTVTITYDPNNLGSITEDSLVIYHYSDSTWTPLSSCLVNTTLHTTTCTTTHFSDFGLFGKVATGGSSSGTHFGCKDPKATNYEFFSSHRQSLCQYALAVIIPTTISPATTNLVTISPLSTSTKYTFTRNLKLYMTGADVKALQQYLNASGFTVSLTGPGSKGAETTMFGGKTQAALIRYQKAKGITPAVGYFGPVTRGVVGK